MHDEGLGLYFWKKSYVGEDVHPAWPAVHARAQHSHTYRHSALHPTPGICNAVFTHPKNFDYMQQSVRTTG